MFLEQNQSAVFNYLCERCCSDCREAPLQKTDFFRKQPLVTGNLLPLVISALLRPQDREWRLQEALRLTNNSAECLAITSIMHDYSEREEISSWIDLALAWGGELKISPVVLWFFWGRRIGTATDSVAWAGTLARALRELASPADALFLGQYVKKRNGPSIDMQETLLLGYSRLPSLWTFWESDPLVEKMNNCSHKLLCLFFQHVSSLENLHTTLSWYIESKISEEALFKAFRYEVGFWREDLQDREALLFLIVQQPDFLIRRELLEIGKSENEKNFVRFALYLDRFQGRKALSALGTLLRNSFLFSSSLQWLEYLDTKSAVYQVARLDLLNEISPLAAQIFFQEDADEAVSLSAKKLSENGLKVL